VRKVRRRTRAQTVRRSLRVVFSLLFLAAAAGFGLGIWQEVESAPERYGRVEPETDSPFFRVLAIKAARLAAALQEENPDRRAVWDIAGADDQPGTGGRISPPDRIPPANSRTPRGTAVRKPEVPDFEPDLTGPPGPGDVPGPPEDLPEPPPDLKPPSISQPPTLPRLPRPKSDDARTRELLGKAHEAYDTAWKWYLKSRPEAPAGGRDAAGRQAIRYLKEARKHYHAVLERPISAHLKKRVEDRVVQINAMLYWTYKHTQVVPR
jgi:hypothetical protein